MTKRSEIKPQIGSEIEQSDLEKIVEDIRLSALNMAITAARLKLSGESKTVIRRKISDLITMSLDTVTRLAHVFDGMRNGNHEKAGDPSAFIEELQSIETAIQDRSAEVIALLRKAHSDTS